MITVVGKRFASRKDVAAVKMQPPRRKAGRMWAGVPHGELLDTLTLHFRRRGWTITKETFCLSSDKADLAAAFELQVPGVIVPPDQKLGMGLLTSNAMRRALRIVVGTTVTVCNNGLVTGEVVMTRKHTRGVNLHEELQEALERYVTKAQNIQDTVAGLKAVHLDQSRVEHILMEAGRQGFMPWSRIGLVDREFRHPRFEEFFEPTSWSLLNAFTWVVKHNPALEQMDQINAFRELLPTEQLLAG